jgi:hypothetical protein
MLRFSFVLYHYHYAIFVTFLLVKRMYFYHIMKLLASCVYLLFSISGIMVICPLRNSVTTNVFILEHLSSYRMQFISSLKICLCLGSRLYLFSSSFYCVNHSICTVYCPSFDLLYSDLFLILSINLLL